MSKLTITEALAEIQTIRKRISKKQEFVQNYLYRQEMLKDPLQADGGSVAAIEHELQSIHDLETRQIELRRAIARANTENTIRAGDYEKTIADWLVWRREIAPIQQAFLSRLSYQLVQIRQEAQRKGAIVTSGEAKNPQDYVVNISEQDLAIEIENLETVLGTLDGQLSLKNATIVLDV